ncbi:DUF4097 family beta strand repeat-containing protein [Paludibaculum fermentans]|uniref:DUF4097 family beta strand repeat-containing protein n=1 Tax=Paludibaculum fermentans TaxID=1473598 RepID=UPI003EBC822D
MSDGYRRSPIFLAAGILLAGTVQLLASDPGSFDRTLPVSGPVYLDVRSDPGGLIISSGSAASVRVRAIIKPLFGRLDLDLAEANIRALEKDPPIEQAGNRLRIGYPKDPSLLRGVSIRFEIETPQATEVRATTTSGGIRIDGIDGPVNTTTNSGRTEVTNVAGAIQVSVHSGAVTVRDAGSSVVVRSQSGGIQLTGIRGAAEILTTSGRQEIGDVSGTLRATTQSGSIRIDDAKAGVTARNSSGSITALRAGGSVHAETTSGEIRIEQRNPAPIRAVAGSGAIHVQLADGGGYLIDALSRSGKISAPAGIATQIARDGHSLKAQLGSGGPLVDLDTRSSRIEIR